MPSGLMNTANLMPGSVEPVKNVGDSFLANEKNADSMSTKSTNDGSFVINKPYGDTYRGIFSDWFNGRGKANEDFIREDQMNQLQFKRESEWQEKMANTAYQRTVEDLKKAGLNPILAYDNAPTQSFSVPSSSGRSRKNNNDGADSLITGLAKIIAGLLTKRTN